MSADAKLYFGLIFFLGAGIALIGGSDEKQFGLGIGLMFGAVTRFQLDWIDARSRKAAK